MDGNSIRLLLIEDDPDDALLMRKMLARQQEALPHFEVECVGRIHDGIQYLAHHKIDMVLLDLTLPDSRGMESFSMLRGYMLSTPIVVLTDLDDDSVALEAVRHGAQDYLIKRRIDRSMLVRTILYAMERHRIKQELNLTTDKLKKANAELEKLSLLDPLTELLNRRGLQQVLSRELAGRTRLGTDLIAMLVDLDDFKRINDTLGYTVGDVVLKEVAAKLQTCLRATDYVARVGGDEFIILLPHTRVAEGTLVAEKVRLTLAEGTIMLADQKIVVTSSLGVFTVTETTQSIEELLSKAHHLIHQSKVAGKNRVVSDHEMLSERRQGIDFKTKIFDGISQGNLVQSVKQPLIKLDDESVAGYEFLTRLKVPGFEMPDAFFRLAMEANILTVIDHYCFKQAVKVSFDLKPGMQIHLNLFPSTLLSIPPKQLLERMNLGEKKRQYCIEISEKQIIGSPAYLVDILKTLKDAGVMIAIDDVGFGHSCLESLILLEPDVIKIDRSCIFGISRETCLVRTLQRLIKVADSLGTQIIAEGIETREDLEVLKELGVEYGQGFLFGRPA